MKKLLNFLSIIVLAIALVGCGGEKVEKQQQEEKVNQEASTDNTKVSSLKFGELLDVTTNNDILIIKAKISPSYNNKATINQNGFNVEDIILNQGGDAFNEIQYWAVADIDRKSVV